MKLICVFQAKSFENYQLTFLSVGISVRVVTIYRIHPIKGNSLTAADFFRTFSGFVHSLATNSGHLLILDDYVGITRGMQITNNWLTFLDLSISCSVYTNEHTGKEISLIFSSPTMIKGMSVSSMLYTKVTSYKKYPSTDKDAFLVDLVVSSTVLDSPDDIDHPVNLYNSTRRDLVDEQAPLGIKEIPGISLPPWHSKDIQAGKRRRRYLERMWIRTGLCIHHGMFKVKWLMEKCRDILISQVTKIVNI